LEGGEKMIVGIDLDGVLTNIPLRTKLKLPWWLGLWLAFVPVNQKMLSILKKWRKNNCRIIIISGRPEGLLKITQQWLEKNQVPYDKIFLNNGKQKEEQKLEIIKREGVSVFFEDDPLVFNFLTRKCPWLKIFSPKQIRRF